MLKILNELIIEQNSWFYNGVLYSPPPLPHHPLLHRPKHQPGMGLYPGFLHDGGAVAHETAGADVELSGDIGTVGVLAHQADDAELGGVEAHYFQTGGIEKATTDQGGDFAGGGFAVIPLSPPSVRPA